MTDSPVDLYDVYGYIPCDVLPKSDINSCKQAIENRARLGNENEEEQDLPNPPLTVPTIPPTLEPRGIAVDVTIEPTPAAEAEKPTVILVCGDYSQCGSNINPHAPTGGEGSFGELIAQLQEKGINVLITTADSTVGAKKANTADAINHHISENQGEYIIIGHSSGADAAAVAGIESIHYGNQDNIAAVVLLDAYLIYGSNVEGEGVLNLVESTQNFPASINHPNHITKSLLGSSYFPVMLLSSNQPGNLHFWIDGSNASLTPNVLSAFLKYPGLDHNQIDNSLTVATDIVEHLTRLGALDPC